MSFKHHPYGYNADIQLGLEKLPLPLQMERLVRFFLYSIREYDIFHFNFGASLLSNFRSPFIPDLGFLTARGKKIFVTYQGCDARIKGYGRSECKYSACHAGFCTNRWCNWAMDKIRARRARVFSRKANAIFCLNPDLCRFIPEGVFLPYAHVDVREWVPDRSERSSGRKEIVVLHAPSDRKIKGTAYIESSMRRLRSRYPNVVFDLLEGIPHTQLKEKIKRADIVVDQLLVGWYGGLAVEAMAMGKPVIAYIREEDLQFIPVDMANELPVVNANIENFESVMGELVQNGEARRAVGERGRAYVERWHDPIKVAQMTLRYYEAKPYHPTAKY
jgi:hypothetical protein